MENRIKTRQLQLFADRVSTHYMLSNQLRRYFSGFATSAGSVTAGWPEKSGVRSAMLSGAQLGQAICCPLEIRFSPQGVFVMLFRLIQTVKPKRRLPHAIMENV